MADRYKQLVNNTEESRDGPSLKNEDLIKRVERSNCLKVGLIVFGEMGHVTPMVRLASALEEEGHEIRFYSCKYQETKVQKMLD